MKILIVATGSVAVTKTKMVIELLEKDHQVKVIVSDYVRKYFDDVKILKPIKEIKNLSSFPLHIKHAKWADLILVVPASTNTIAKFASGINDNQVLSTLLAARQGIIFVPAANTFMYNAIEQRGIIDQLMLLGHMFIGPTSGQLREGEIGLGRMVEPKEIVQIVHNYFKSSGKNILVPYGASKVYIDQIRYISNNSSGTFAKLLINELRLNGYQVKGVDISNLTNQEFINLALTIDFDYYISPAAFADFQVQKINAKIRKNEIDKIDLLPNQDVITILKMAKSHAKFIAFKLDESKMRAIKKMKRLDLDGILWNDLNSFGDKEISGALIMRDKETTFKNTSKTKIAKLIVKSLF